MSGYPESIVFDTEPLVAYFCNEPGSDTVERHLAAVERASDGYISAVNLAELHYVVRSIVGKERADTVVDVLEESGIERVDTDETWPTAAGFKSRYSPALGDAFALATAAHVDGTLLIGADDDYDDVADIDLVRFRTDGV
ncbi:PIN domain-containing protein [Natranaeroarchaeum sulfidigenes]|uniref:Ribonuclease VapC n=1 Tax=Natranaeroarchaeum sulfidigenes TaxID=2784880 RepID=A0A897MTS5_9EURY|nr:PIN domain-containing protein [Natranaeroarchaeum sulfidigenes]QSG01596.1 PIN domain containing protein [Natranaeroarchaeum sulfidigenes]